jgi:hypothetical protein
MCTAVLVTRSVTIWRGSSPRFKVPPLLLSATTLRARGSPGLFCCHSPGARTRRKASGGLEERLDERDNQRCGYDPARHGPLRKGRYLVAGAQWAASVRALRLRRNQYACDPRRHLVCRCVARDRPHSRPLSAEPTCPGSRRLGVALGTAKRVDLDPRHGAVCATVLGLVRTSGCED